MRLSLLLSIGIVVVSCGQDEEEAKSLLTDYFNVNRHPQRKDSNFEVRQDVQDAITEIFQDSRLTVDYEEFETSVIVDGDQKQTSRGKNIIGLMKGRNWMTGNDNVLVIGAHYDTDVLSKGVNDNGSGMVAMIQVIQKLRAHAGRCAYNNTVIFVAFDLNTREYMWNTRDSNTGSRTFINQYLIPKILSPSLPSARPNFFGTIVIDSVLNYNSSQDTQTLPKGFDGEFQDEYNHIAKNRFAGNFITLVRKRGMPSQLGQRFSKAWDEVEADLRNADEIHKLIRLAIDPDDKVSETVQHFTKQDHTAFWDYSKLLDTVLITDTGNMRGYMRQCSDTPCDDVTSVQPEHLRFLSHTVKALFAVVKDLAVKDCSVLSSTSRLTSNMIIIIISIIILTKLL